MNFILVTPTVEDGWFEVTAGRKVGAMTMGERQIIVRPKIADLNRLIFLLGYVQNPRVWRDDLVHLDGADELMPALAEAFGRIATRAVEWGLLQGYRTVRETLPVLRGRMLAGEQMGRRYGLQVPIAVEYDDFSIDVPENQVLAMATLRLLRVPRISEPARRLLHRLRRTFAGVAVPPRGGAVPRWQRTRLNARYHSALRIAEIVLAAESFEHRMGDLTVSGYVFDMWRVFEDFVTVAMSEALNENGWNCSIQASMHLDVGNAVDMRPDLLCWREERSAVVDAKYKAERPEGFPNADLYQMLAYCTVLGLRDGHLIYAKGNEDATSYTVRNAGIAIHCHAFDLALAPDELLDQVGRLAASVSGSTGSSSNAYGRIDSEWSRSIV